MKKVAFITGANGFVGSHLVELLIEKGMEVHCLMRA
ncbi:MAG: GDP-mannose 4,6-dehydratase, partial [Chitinophagales bacterium]